jgi:putative oxidoreductase
MNATLSGLIDKANHALQALLPLTNLALRIYIAQVFFLSGLSKVGDWETTLYLFREEYHVPLLPPDLAAVLASFGELALPVLLVAGIFTQLSALGLFVLNIMAVISYYATLSTLPAALNDHFQWGLMIALLMTMPHAISVENLWRKYVAPRTQMPIAI